MPQWLIPDQNRYGKGRQSSWGRWWDAFGSCGKQRPGVVGRINFRPLMYYRFAKDFRYANFEIIFKKVHFPSLFVSWPLRFVHVPPHRWQEIVQCKDWNLPFWGKGCLPRWNLRKKWVNFQHALSFSEWKFRFLY